MRFFSFSCTLLLILLLPDLAVAMQAQEPNPVIVSLNTFNDLTVSNDHSEAMTTAIQKMSDTLDKASLDQLREAIPSIRSSMENPNSRVRGNALLFVISINHREASVGGIDAVSLFDLYVPQIAAHLTDPDQFVRRGAIMALSSFSYPPDTIYPPLLAYLKRDDAVTTTIGSGVVSELLLIGATQTSSPRADVEDAIISYLNRPDQSTNLGGVIHSIALLGARSQRVNTAILPFIDSSDPAVRIETIQNLPQLSLPEQNFTAAKARLQVISADLNEPQSVRDAAATILPCWVNDRHKPCPPFTMPPQFQSPPTSPHPHHNP